MPNCIRKTTNIYLSFLFRFDVGHFHAFVFWVHMFAFRWLPNGGLSFSSLFSCFFIFGPVPNERKMWKSTSTCMANPNRLYHIITNETRAQNTQPPPICFATLRHLTISFIFNKKLRKNKQYIGDCKKNKETLMARKKTASKTTTTASYH